MKTEYLTVEQALAQGMALPYALIREMSRVTLGPTPKEPPALDELLDARFFDGTQEIRLFHRDGGLQGACLTKEEGDACIDRPYKPENQNLGNRVVVRDFLDFDREDGQCYIKTSCLAGWSE